MPALGEIVANDAASYKYLAESIRQFPSKDELAVRMRDAGFKNVGYESMTFGMVAIHSGYKL
jgi:demethylmenaquinone methyltransferase/2-methoxy-6-polyprenyl-1,4-benzoquinol methylase